MTDWKTTMDGGSSPVGYMRAGNNLIMPGNDSDITQIETALHDGSLTLEAV